MAFKNIRQFLFRNKKQEIEYTAKMNAIMESKESTSRGIPKYSWNRHCTRNKMEAVAKAPSPSTRKIVLGFKID
jgi:hypothetical protein